MNSCPVCGKPALRREVRKSRLYGFDLGIYSAEVCGSCGEIFWKEADIRKM
jgi:YgiT-type zinc finger domain-containing protein